MAQLAELRERVLAATGPDRELDALIYCWRYKSAYPDETEDQHLDYARRASPSYTSSIDAALALVEKTLPDMHLDIKWPALRKHTLYQEKRFGGPKEWLVIADVNWWCRSINDGKSKWAGGATIPLAILAALLSALEAKGGA